LAKRHGAVLGFQESRLGCGEETHQLVLVAMHHAHEVSQNVSAAETLSAEATASAEVTASAEEMELNALLASARKAAPTVRCGEEMRVAS